jgi:hypothetical protein
VAACGRQRRLRDATGAEGVEAATVVARGTVPSQTASTPVASYNPGSRHPVPDSLPRRMDVRSIVMTLAVAASLALVPQAPPPPAAPSSAEAALGRLMTLASGWTARFEQSLSGMLFRERYLQRALTSHTVRQGDSMSELIVIPPNTTRGIPREVLLEANLFMIRVPGANRFVVYRDVYRVGTEAVGDHTERLQKLLLSGTAESIDQARKLTDASARFNLGGVRRNVNVPTMAFEYLGPAALPGLRVRAVDRDKVADLDTIVVEFEEAARPTIVRGRNDDEDVPATGKYWIHPGSGAVVRAQVMLNLPGGKGRIEVELQLEPRLGAWVPKEMTEVWETGPGSVTGLARYDRFQRLAVSTAEIIK